MTSQRISPVSAISYGHKDAKVESIAGSAHFANVWQFQSFDVNRLREDLKIAIYGWDWSRASFGHSLPLTTRRLTKFGATHYNNLIKNREDESLVEAPDFLDRCAYFREIFDTFQCDISAFRILRRPAHSSYTLHMDPDVGEDVYRFQIPIQTNPDVRLLVSTTNNRDDFVVSGTDYRKVEDWDTHGIGCDRLRSWYDEFVQLNDDRVRVYQLESGKLYYFNTQNYHNVWNFGSDERFTLAMDLVGNRWLYESYPQILEQS